VATTYVQVMAVERHHVAHFCLLWHKWI